MHPAYRPRLAPLSSRTRPDPRPGRAEERVAPVVGLLEVSVVLPAHNEEALVATTIAEVHAALRARGLAFEIVVVENGSVDATLAHARMLAARLDRVRVLTLPVGDYGAALAAGFAAAAGSVVVSFDVDYYDFDFLDRALELLEEQDVAVVVASKRCAGAADGRPPLRKLLTWGFTELLRRAVALPVSDAHGIKAFARVPLTGVLRECELRGPMFDVELVVRAGRRGLRLAELPASVAEVRPPRSPVWWRAVEGALGIIRLRAALSR